LDRFRHVLDGKRCVCLQVGDGAGNFQDAVVGAGGKAEFVDGGFEQIVRGVVDAAVFFYVAAAYLGIAVYFCSFKPFGLHAAGGGDPLLYGCQ
jgi:hypothetical protein